MASCFLCGWVDVKTLLLVLVIAESFDCSSTEAHQNSKPELHHLILIKMNHAI